MTSLHCVQHHSINMQLSFTLDVVLLQGCPEGKQSSEPKMESSGSAGGELSAPSASGSSSKPEGSTTVSYSLLPSKPLVKLDTPSATPQPSVSSSSLSIGDRTQVRRTPSPMENLIGSPRRYGDGESRTSSYLTSSDLLKGPRPYQPWDVADLNICHWISDSTKIWWWIKQNKDRCFSCD